MQFHVAYSSYLNRKYTKMKALYHAIRDAIHEGNLIHGEKLPSTRELAATYHISRGTVNQVYDTLTAQGYIHSEHGRGTFVAYQLDLNNNASTEKACTHHLSAWGNRIQQFEQQSIQRNTPANAHTHDSRMNSDEVIDFSKYQPDFSKFPYDEWNNRLYAEIRHREHHLKTTSAMVSSTGDPKLREAILCLSAEDAGHSSRSGSYCSNCRLHASYSSTHSITCRSWGLCSDRESLLRRDF